MWNYLNDLVRVTGRMRPVQFTVRTHMPRASPNVLLIVNTVTRPATPLRYTTRADGDLSRSEVECRECPILHEMAIRSLD